MKVSPIIWIVIATSSLALGQSNPVPFVNQPLVPAVVVPGSPGFTLTVNGTGFVPGSVVKWNKAPLTTTFVSSSQLTADVPAANVSAASSAAVTVTSPPPGGGVSRALYFDVSLPVSFLTFSASPSEPPPLPPESIYTADLNGDGKLDLIEVAQGFTVELGNGDGTFQSAATYGSADCLSDAVIYDFNGDGVLDIAALGSTNGCSGNGTGIFVFLGNGDGTFQSPVFTSLPGGPFALATGDFNGDGKLDLAIACATSQQTCILSGSGYGGVIAIFLGNSDGTFQKEVDYVPAGWQDINPATSLIVGDYNGNGTLDIAFSDPAGPEGLQVLEGNGDGTFYFVNTPNTPQSGNSIPLVDVNGYNGLVAADVNGDGKLDLVNIDQVYLGNGDDTFQAPISTGGPMSARTAIVGDLNGDGILDITGVYEPDLFNSPWCLSFSLGNGDGTFQSYNNFPLQICAYPIYDAAIGDFNNDGLVDVAVNGQGNFAPVPISLQTLLPQLYTYPNSLTFSAEIVGTTSPPQMVRLTNNASGTLTINSISAAGSFAETNTCGSSLASKASCSVSVAFTPTVAGASQNSLTITDSGPASPHKVALTGTGSDYSVTLASPKSVTISPGQTAKYTLSVAPMSGFNHEVSMSCTGAPAQSTCTVTPASVTLDGTHAVQVTVAVVTTTQSATNANPMQDGQHPGIAIWLAITGGVFGFLIIPAAIPCKRRGKLIAGLMGLVLIFAVLETSGCGGGSSGSTGSSGTTGGTSAGTYSLTVIANYTYGSVNLVHSTTLILVVQ